MPRDSAAIGDRIALTIDGIAAGGAGVGRLPDGRAAFVHRTAPGDRVEVEITRLKKRWARARLVRVLNPGPGRREPPCPFYERCGGCTLEHLTYEAQLETKASLVDEALRRIGGLTSLPRVEMRPSPRETRYRNRVSFTLRRDHGSGTAVRGTAGSGNTQAGRERGVIAGFHELEAPERLIDLDGGCLLPDAAIARAWDELRSAWGEGARRLPSGVELRLTLRSIADEFVLLLVEGGEDDGDAADLLDRTPSIQAIWRRSTPRERPVLLAGADDLEEIWYGECYPIRPGAFLQVNREAAEHLHDLVLRELGPPRGRRVLDAYCGVGVYGRRMARHGATAVGIELDAGAVGMARARAVEGFRIVEGKVEDRLEELLPADVVVLNPPRAGAAQEVMRTLARAAPQRLVYVSCDPATLGRDLARLGPGYAVRRIQAFDLFPQTAHIETVVTLDHVGS